MHDPPTDSMRLNPKTITDFFSRSLTSFQSSRDAFRVLCTLPHQARSNPAPRKPTAVVSDLVVLDSSFNPPTTAHALMAKSALRASAAATGRKRLMLLLAVNNADKAPKPASFPIRLSMMDAFGRQLLEDVAASDGEEDLEIDVAVTTMPFFHEKSQAMAAQYSASSPPPQQTFLAGFDTLIRIFNPKYYGGGDGGMQAALGPFFEAARLRVTLRPDDEWGSAEEQMAYVRGGGGLKLQEVGGDDAWLGRVDVVEGVGEVVSSSMVRAMVGRGGAEWEKEVERVVGREVREWIEREGLYRE